MSLLDMRGKPCPIPVIEAKKALISAGADGVTVLVDNAIAVQNLRKMAEGTRRTCLDEQRGEDDYAVTIAPGGQVDVSAPALQNSQGATVLITCDQMGRGSEELGKILIKGFIYALTQLDIPPKAVLFLNAGVKLAVLGANTVSDLKALEEAGVQIRACGTCLNYYGLTEQLAVGEIANMMDIAQAITGAEKAVIL